MLSGWSSKIGISSLVPSRPGFVMEKKSQRGNCGIALHGGAVAGGLWACLKCKPGAWSLPKLLEITRELSFRALWEARNLNACGLLVARY